MIDVRDIMKDYVTFYREHREEELDKIKEGNFSEEEINAGLSKIVLGVSDIIRSLKFADDVAEYVAAIPSIRENIYNKDRQQYAVKKITHDYDDIHAFINKDAEKVSNKIDLEPPIADSRMPEYLDIMYSIAVDCIDICLEKFKLDIEEYKSKKHISWAEKVTHKATVDGQQMVISKPMKDNEGNREDWKARMASKKLGIEKENQVS
jgi:hypothetical protein